MSLRPLITWYKRRFLSSRTDFLPRCIALNDITGGYPDLTVPINKNFDLLRMLERLRPRSILEFGSGTTTLMFDFYARTHSARVETHEHDPKWFEAVKPRIVGTEVDYRLDELRVLDESTEYATEFTGQYDFLYIDAPPLLDRKFNSDFLKVIEQPSLKTIVLDIRDSTAREIFDFLASHGLRARIKVHKRFPMDTISNDAKAALDIGRWWDKRHNLIEIERA